MWLTDSSTRLEIMMVPKQIVLPSIITLDHSG